VNAASSTGATAIPAPNDYASFDPLLSPHFYPNGVDATVAGATSGIVGHDDVNHPLPPMTAAAGSGGG
jgi:hypothetical protein